MGKKETGTRMRKRKATLLTVRPTLVVVAVAAVAFVAVLDVAVVWKKQQ